ncbi:MAG TPA: HAD hydrolase-like protein [Terriglobia bacterium]|nr:HAD hydrolase-like protein [Terriglobia bacterium]
MKLFLFDVDQTLISTGGAGIRAMNRAFRSVLDIDNAMDGMLLHGKTDPSIVREAGLARGVETGARLDAILEAYIAFLRDEIQVSPYEVLPGVNALLDLLSVHSGVMLALATGNVEAGARIKLERGRLNHYFAFGGFGSDSECRISLVRRAAEIAAARRGQAFPSEDVFVIGDTPRDVDAARGAGFQSVAVATGRYSLEDLASHGASVTISNLQSGRDRLMNILD